MKSIAIGIVSAACFMASVYSGAHGMQTDSYFTFMWGIISFGWLLVQPRND